MSDSTPNVEGFHSGLALCSVEEFTSQVYDYVVVGGGTAGLCVAARLSENPDVRVGIIEAGANRMDDKQISTPSLYPSLIGREDYDWCMTSVPQVRDFIFVAIIHIAETDIREAISRKQDILHATRQSVGRQLCYKLPHVRPW
jgi:predicted flavoprotein YhiN